MTKELRQWAIEQAILAQAKDVVSVATTYLEFVQEDDTLTRKAKQAEQDERGEVEVEWHPKKLSQGKERVMLNVISRFNRDLPINGVKIAGDLKLTQSCVSSHLVELVKEGYVGRKGNKFWPLRSITGKLLPVLVHKMPKGVAQGYQGQMKAPLAEIARVK
jgi:hypothetical protein